MKKLILVILALALAVTVILIAGCGNEESQAPSEETDMQAMDEEANTQMPVENMEEEMPGEEEGPSAYVDITPQQALALIEQNPDLIIIDVSPHYAEGHLPGAVSYPLDDGSLDAAIPTLDANAEYLVYCHVDSVAIAGAQKLIDAGFMNVYRLEGNYSAWVNAGYAIEQ